MMLAAGRPDSTVGWVLVCRELGLLTTEIGRVHRARGELDRAREIESQLYRELGQIRVLIDGEPSGWIELDAEAEAARQATAPLDPVTRAPRPSAGDESDVEAVRRLIDPTRGRGPRRR